VIEQAIYGTEGPGGYQFLARSAGFQDDWLPVAQQLCTGFGERPAGVSCPGCVFARPFGRQQVAVVQVADQGRDDAGRPGALAFRLLILPRPLYITLGGDPFHIADQFEPPWDTRGTLPVLEWPGPFTPPRREVAEIQKVLNVPYSATLLGGVQALVDGGRLVFERTQPDPHLVRSLWALLPTSTRGELWPTSFAFSNAQGFDVLVVPRASGPDFERYVHEEQAGDYPEGRYEHGLQQAAEAGQQRELDALFGRRSRSQTLRLALGLLVVFLVAPVLGLMIGTQMQPPDTPKPSATASRPEFPPVEACPPLERWEREKLREALGRLCERYQLPPPRSSSPADLAVALDSLDARLRMPSTRHDPGRRGRVVLAVNALTLPASPTGQGPLLVAAALTSGPSGQLRDFGPLQRQLRVLLWKQDVPEYNARGVNTIELVEKLEKRLFPAEG